MVDAGSFSCNGQGSCEIFHHLHHAAQLPRQCTKRQSVVMLVQRRRRSGRRKHTFRLGHYSMRLMHAAGEARSPNPIVILLWSDDRRSLSSWTRLTHGYKRTTTMPCSPMDTLVSSRHQALRFTLSPSISEFSLRPTCNPSATLGKHNSSQANT